MAKTQTELLAEVNENVSELVEIVEKKDAVIDKKVNDKIKELEEWKQYFNGLEIGSAIGDTGYIKKYFTSDNSNNTNIDEAERTNLHFVTDIHQKESRTFCITIKGQMLNEPMVVDTTIVGYMYGANGLVNVDISNNPNNRFSVYINSSGFVTVKYTGNHYYASLRIETIVVGNGGIVKIPEILISKEDI